MGGYVPPPAAAPVPLGPHVPRPAERTTLPTALVALPDPTTLGAEIVELGTLELPVRAGKGRTLSAVAARLLPHGGVPPYSPPQTSYSLATKQPDPDVGQLFVHDNLVALRLASTGTIQNYSRMVATSLECGYDSGSDCDDTSTDSGAAALALAGPKKTAVVDYTAVNLMLRRRPRREGIAPPSRIVTHRIILVDVTGTQPPTEHALPFSRTSKNSDLLVSVAALLASSAVGAAPPAGSAFAVLEYDNGTSADSGIRPKWVVGMKVGKGGPNPTSPHLNTKIYEWGVEGDPSATKMTARDKRPRYLVFTGLPCAPNPLSGLPPPHRFAVVWLRHRQMQVTQHKHRRGRMAYTSSHLTRTVFGIPFLLAVPEGVDPYAGGTPFLKAIQNGLRACVAHSVVEGAAYEEPLLTRCGASGNYSASKWGDEDQAMFMCPNFQRLHGNYGTEECDGLVDEQGNYKGAVKGEDSGYDMDTGDDESGEGGGPPGLSGDALTQLRGAELLLTHKVTAAAPRAVFVAATWAKGKVDAMFTPDTAARKFALAPTAEADGDGDARARQQAAETSQRVEDQAALWRELKGATQVVWHHTPAIGNASAPAGFYRPGYYYQNTPTLRYTLSLVPDSGGGDTGVLAVRLFGVRTPRPSIYAPAGMPGPCDYIFGEGTNVNGIGRIIDALWRTKSAPFRKNELDADAIHREVADRSDVCTLPGLLAACVAGDKAEAPQPAGLAVSLRPYQKQALQFCVQNETEEHIPQLFWTSMQLPDGTGAWYSTAQKRLLLSAPPAQPKGGFMCLDMGLGKTVCTLALILAQPESPAQAAAVKAEIATSGLGLHHSSATLVVCAVSLVGQWIAEAKSKLSDDSSLRIHMYHGTGRIKNTAKLAKDYDLVVTTYETLGSDFGKDMAKHNPKKLFPPLGAIHWHRVILDESHSIGSAGVNKSLACLRLHASRRWCVTGTPCGNSIGELQGQLAFLKAHPWTENSFFSSQATHVFGTTGNRYGGSPDLLLYTLRRLMVRHTKTQTLGGKAVLELPPKTEVTIPVELSAEERKVYDKCLADAKGQFTRILARGPAAVSQQLLAIMSLLLPLRRICSGGALMPKDIGVPDLDAAEKARQAARLADLQAKQAAANAAAAAWGYGAGGGAFPAGYAAGGPYGGSDDDEKKPHLSGPPPAVAGPSGAAAAAPAPAAPDSPVDAKPVLAMTPDDEEMCCQCGELCEEPVRTGCKHWFCKECFLECMPTSARASAAKCPKCSKPVSAAALMDDAAADAGADAADDTSAGAGPGAAAGPSTAKAAAATAAKGKGKAKAKAPKRKRKASSDEDESEEEWQSDSDSDASDAAPKAKAAAKGKAAAAAPPKPAAGGGKTRVTRAAKAPVGPLALQSESKLQALLKELTKMRAEDESHKALVFSQFIGTLEWLKSRLPEEGFGYRTISGSMPLNQRAKAIAAFQEDPPTTVFLLSVRSGAVGINLTSASHVFVMEPLLNPALEAQAIGRAWRMGQTRSVKVVHFVTKDTVEQRIVELNATRAQARGAQGGGAAALELANRKGKGKVRITEIAGAIRADKQDLRAEELQLLFS
jgi:SNF2 family DNA or RNA helicase